MRANLETSLSKIFGAEGGFSNRPLSQDPGGATKYGITIGTLSSVRGRQVTVDEVRNLTLREAAEIYRSRYAAPVKFDDLPSGVDFAALDYSVNSGPGKAVKGLQKVVGVRQDGVLGPATMAAIARMNPVVLIDALQNERWAFMQGLKNFNANKNGWRTRVEKVRREAKAMAAVSVPKVATLVAYDDAEPAIPQPEFGAVVSEMIQLGADAKADPRLTSTISTMAGKGIAITGLGGAVAIALDTLRSMIGLDGFADKAFIGLTLVALAVAAFGLWQSYKGTKKTITEEVLA